jgi:TPP-dependent pyruvate/acetoin dehydrogenase alpha subunit
MTATEQTATEQTARAGATDTAAEQLRAMLRIRRFEEKCAEL